MISKLIVCHRYSASSLIAVSYNKRAHGEDPGDIYIIEADINQVEHRMYVHIRRLTTGGGFQQPKITDELDFYCNSDWNGKFAKW